MCGYSSRIARIGASSRASLEGNPETPRPKGFPRNAKRFAFREADIGRGCSGATRQNLSCFFAVGSDDFRT